MKNDARALGHEPVRLAGSRQIRCHRAHLKRRVGRRLRRDDVVQGRLRDPSCAQRTVFRQTLKELAADHAGGADDEDPIHVNPKVCVIYLTLSSSPLADSGRLSFTGRLYMVVPAGVPPCARNEFSVCWSWRAPRSPWRGPCFPAAPRPVSRRPPGTKHPTASSAGGLPPPPPPVRFGGPPGGCFAFPP